MMTSVQVPAAFEKRLLGVKWSVVILALFLCLCWGCSLESDSSLARNFENHRSDFERLIQMYGEDVHLTTIAPGFTYLDVNASWPRKEVGITEQRWNEYRSLFKRVGTSYGVSRRIEFPGAIFVPMSTFGAAPSSAAKGYVYSTDSLSPILRSLDQPLPPESLDKKTQTSIGFKYLSKDWYLYYFDD